MLWLLILFMKINKFRSHGQKFIAKQNEKLDYSHVSCIMMAPKAFVRYHNS